jgi:hypothetical protein
MNLKLLSSKDKFEAHKLNNGVLIIFLIVSLIFIFSLAYSSLDKSVFNKKTTQTQQTPH